MKVQELIDELQEYPEDIDVEVTLENFDGCFSADAEYTELVNF